MALRQIIKEGDDVLRKRSREIEKINDRIDQLIDDMFDTMYENRGVGLAAPQVGVLRRLFVVDIQDGSDPIVAINPRISGTSGSQTGQEGCLSVPGMWGDVERPENLVLEAMDRDGNPFTLEAEGFLAVAISHEFDHLEGVLFIDKVKGELISQ